MVVFTIFSTFILASFALKDYIYECNDLNDLEYMGRFVSTAPDPRDTIWLPKDKCRQCAGAQINEVMQPGTKRKAGVCFVYPPFPVIGPKVPPGKTQRRPPKYTDMNVVSRGRCYYNIDTQECHLGPVPIDNFGVLVTSNSVTKCEYFTTVGHMLRSSIVAFTTAAWNLMKYHVENVDTDPTKNHAGGHLYNSKKPPAWWTTATALALETTNIALGLFKVSWNAVDLSSPTKEVKKFYKTYFVQDAGPITLFGATYDFTRTWTMESIKVVCVGAMEAFFNAAKARFPFESDIPFTTQTFDGVPLFIYPKYALVSPARNGGGSCYANI